MFKIIIENELRAILYSPKFVATFATCSLLMLLSVFVGIQEYRASVRQYEASLSLADQQLQEASSYSGVNMRTYRAPDPMQVFVSGVQNDIGRFSDINASEALKLTNSVYSDDPIFAIFRFIDFTFIVQVVLSLFAILFTFDAINGERERGTLKLIFSNAVSRAEYVLSKSIGAWLGLLAPLAIPVLLSLMLVSLFKIQLQPEHWMRLAILLAAAVLFFTFFVFLGVLISTLTRHSSVSFMLLLVSWVALVLIVPRAAVMAAGQIVPVPSIAEIEGREDGFAKSQWRTYEQQLAKRWQQRNGEMAGLSPADRQAYRDEHLWQWMEQDDAARTEIQEEINAFRTKLNEDLRNRKAELQRSAFTLSRLSPASAFQLTAMNLAGTNIDLKSRYEDSMASYRSELIAYGRRKQKESGTTGGIRITIDSEAGLNISTGRDKGTLDFSDMPRFQPPRRSLAQATAPAVVDLGLLALYSLLALAGAFVRFLRYDVR